MKIYLIILLSLSTLQSRSQKQRLVGDNLTFLCKADSITFFAVGKIKKKEIDTLISISHDYDNGRFETGYHVIIWIENGVTFARKITGCDIIQEDTLFHPDILNIIRYFTSTTMPPEYSRIKNDNSQSHDTGYVIHIQTSNKKYNFQVRDNAMAETKEHIVGSFDPRIVLTKMLRKFVP